MSNGAMNKGDIIQYVPFSSCVNNTFWHKLAQLKLEVDCLNENCHSIWGYFNNTELRGLNSVLSVDCSSFNSNPDEGSVVMIGSILNKNTIDSFRDVDKFKLLQEEGLRLKDLIKKDALENPQVLSRFTVLCFGDLKSHRFTYWFAFPALNIVSAHLDLPPYYAEELLDEKSMQDLSNMDRKTNLCVVRISKENGAEFFSVAEGFQLMKGGGNWFLAYADSSNAEDHPGWPLRNYLALYAYHCPELLKLPVQVLCLRFSLKNEKWSAGRSLVLMLNLKVEQDDWNKPECCVGWERNDKGNFGPRLANLQSSMDPLALAESSVDLNLKLMKWQVVPDLDLDIIQKTKCLLLGAGTLGSVVARSLLAWGVRHITMLDNAKVSYSNPSRQCLYQFSDVGSDKATAAAKALKSIFPAVTSEGVVLSIPMPGHPVGESLLLETKSSIAKLDNLIQNHDAVFLLMDSRESRWLPSVLGAAHNKLVINAALGFDSYLVMRHGVKGQKQLTGTTTESSGKAICGSSLGCYFCSDVTAPGNSGFARTLDQQCTVTRPGVSNMAGSLAVELLVSILQHPCQGQAPAYTELREDGDCILGIIPHSIRGFLSRFQTVLPAIEAFSSCVACSSKVIAAYKTEGIDFVLKVLESKEYLEELTGLTILQKESLAADIIELASDDDAN